MRIATSSVRPGDIVRGIGLVVEYVEPQSEYTTTLTGHVGRDEVFSGVTVSLPNEHLVNVRRAFQPGDRVTIPMAYVVEEVGDYDLYAEPNQYLEFEVDEVRADERQLVVFDVTSELPLEDRVRVAVPFNRARHAV